MRLLVLQSELGVLRGGGENFTRNLFTAFSARGHHVTAAFVASPQSHYAIPLPSCVAAIPLNGWWSRKLGQATLSSLSGLLPSESRVKKAWDRVQDALCWRTIRWHDRRFHQRVVREFARRWHEFDAVYVHGNVSLASELAQQRPTILRLPGPVSETLAPALRIIPAVCANGDVLVRLRTLLNEHVTELPIGIDHTLFSPGETSLRSTLDWTDKHFVIGYVGRLTYLKGIDILAAAFHNFAQTESRARLLIVGSGEEEHKVRLLLASEIAQGLVHIEPDVDHAHLPQWYRAMNVLVMPSRYENFSNALLEAMACGLPIVASDVGGNRMLVDTGAGWTFTPGAVASLQECLAQVCAHPTEMGRRGATGRQYVHERYSWTASAACLETILVQRLGVVL